jgi:MFS transporter, ACS family, DAL5 transporter family protein
MGNSAGIISSNVYPIGDAPRYIRGHAIALGFSVLPSYLPARFSIPDRRVFLWQCLTIVLSAFMTFYNVRENARRDRVYGVPNPDGSDCSPLYADDPVRLKKWGLEGKSKEEIIALGDQHPAFRCVALIMW